VVVPGRGVFYRRAGQKPKSSKKPFYDMRLARFGGCDWVSGGFGGDEFCPAGPNMFQCWAIEHGLRYTGSRRLKFFEGQTMTRKLHIGGQVKAEGWEVLDVNPGPHVDHPGKADDLSRFPDATFDTVYASHVLEHLDYTGELQKALGEWMRVLRPGGKLYVGVPDLDALARLLLEKELLSLGQRFHVMRLLFGGHVDQYDFHVVGLNEEFLGHFLTETGFVNIKRVERFGLFDDASGLQFEGFPLSLNLIAEKPGGSVAQSVARMFGLGR
jgi:predicted SAM-dependent methyltransferase